MKKSLTKTLAFVLAMLMLLTTVPMSMFASAACDHSYNVVPAHPATATTHGNVKYYKCPTCGNCFDKAGSTVEKDESEFITHLYSEWVPDPETDKDALVTAATCKDQAVYKKKCLVAGCGKLSPTDTFKFGDTLPHTRPVVEEGLEWLQYTVPANADCTAAAFTRTINCTKCGEAIESKNFAKGAHKLRAVPTVAATCQRVGHKAGVMCENCLKYTEGGAELSKVPHNIITTKEAKEATCTQGGWTAGTKCSMCDTQTVESKPVEPLMHKDGMIEVKKKDRTCLEDGYRMDATICKFCDYVFEPTGYDTAAVVIKAPGHHTYTHYAAQTATTSTEGWKEHWRCTQIPGVTEYFTRPKILKTVNGKDTWVDITKDDPEYASYTLNDGKFAYQQVTEASVMIPVVGHDHRWTVVKAKSYAKTCTKDGLEVRKCGICGKEVETVLPAEGHKWDWTIVQEPTCTKEGVMMHQCTVCKESDGITTSVPKGEHKWKLTGNADCTKGGNATYTCEICGATKQEPITLQTRHTDANDDGVCEVCNTKFCNCLCHNQKWYGKILYYFVKIWWQYFGIREKCASADCDKVHYTKQQDPIPDVT